MNAICKNIFLSILLCIFSLSLQAQPNNYFAGDGAGDNNTIGHNNTFVGDSTGYKNDVGVHNTYFGSDAGYYYQGINASGNTFFGSQAGLGDYIGQISTGSDNSFFGNYAGAHNKTGSHNTFMGKYAGNLNSVGSENSFIGSESGYYNTSGARNVFVGSKAGKSNTWGMSNVFVGKSAGNDNTIGDYNVFLGKGAGNMNDTGSGNIAIGFQSGENNVDGNNNLTIGREADVAFSWLENATAIGAFSEVSQDNSMVLGGTGTNAINVGIGTTAPQYALHVSDDDVPNNEFNSVIFGEYVGNLEHVVAVKGVSFSANNGIGGYFKGKGSGVVAEASGSDSSINGVLVTAHDNEGGSDCAGVHTTSAQGNKNYGVKAAAHNGNDNYGVYGTAYGTGNYHAAVYADGDLVYTGSLISTSDKRLKKNIKNVSGSLKKLMLLQPKLYHYKQAEYTDMQLPKGEQVGFLAQDVETVFPNLVSDNYHPIEGENESLHYKGINYIGLIPILTRATQEQQQLVEAQEIKSQKLSDEVSKLKEELAAIKALLQEQRNDNIEPQKRTLEEVIPENSTHYLKQNVPNPSNDSHTLIECFIPKNTHTALLNITDMSGKLIKQYELKEKGVQQTIVNTKKWKPAMYIYSLLLDGSVVASKKMLVK